MSSAIMYPYVSSLNRRRRAKDRRWEWRSLPFHWKSLRAFWWNRDIRRIIHPSTLLPFFYLRRDQGGIFCGIPEASTSVPRLHLHSASECYLLALPTSLEDIHGVRGSTRDPWLISDTRGGYFWHFSFFRSVRLFARERCLVSVCDDRDMMMLMSLYWIAASCV